jgi:hypothetical protein
MTQEQIVQLIFIILPFLLATVAIPATKFFIAKLPVEQQAHATLAVTKAVNAVEQLSTQTTSNLSSTAKKALAEQYATQFLKGMGLSVDSSVIQTLIESAVFLLNASKPLNVSVLSTTGTVPATMAAISTANTGGPTSPLITSGTQQ